MSNKLITEEDVKKALGVKSFRDVSKDKIKDFISLIPNMDKDVAIAIVNQFPAYAEFASTTITELKNICDTTMKSNDASQMESISAYRKILDDLGEVLKKDEITAEERDSISNKMIMVADKIALKDTENKDFIAGLVKYGVPVLASALVIGATILGVNIKGKDIPILKK